MKYPVIIRYFPDGAANTAWKTPPTSDTTILEVKSREQFDQAEALFRDMGVSSWTAYMRDLRRRSVMRVDTFPGAHLAELVGADLRYRDQCW